MEVHQRLFGTCPSGVEFQFVRDDLQRLRAVALSVARPCFEVKQDRHRYGMSSLVSHHEAGHGGRYQAAVLQEGFSVLQILFDAGGIWSRLLDYIQLQQICDLGQLRCHDLSRILLGHFG